MSMQALNLGNYENGHATLFASHPYAQTKQSTITTRGLPCRSPGIKRLDAVASHAVFGSPRHSRYHDVRGEFDHFCGVTREQARHCCYYKLAWILVQ